MKARLLLMTAILALLLAPGRAGAAEGLAGRFAISAQVGTQSEIAGDLTTATEGTLLGNPATIQTKSYRDVYRPALRLQAVLAYGVSEHVELFARGSYYKAQKAGVEVGTYEGRQMFSYFDQYLEWGGEFGVRYYVAPRTRLRSYLGPVVGFRHVDEILVAFSVPDAGTALLNVPFSHGGVLAVFGADLGLEFLVTPSFFLGLDTGIRYQQAPTGFNQPPGLEGFAANEGRWTAPVSFTAGVRF